MTTISRTKISLCAAILLGGESAAAASSLPSLDVQEVCRASVAAPFADNTDDFDICMRDEQAAREKLIVDWASFSTRDKARCVLPGEYLPGYVEWLTCLELERDLRVERQERADKRAVREAKNDPSHRRN